MARVRAIVLGGAVVAGLAGCGTQSHVVPLKPLTPSEVKSLIRSIKPPCKAPEQVLVRYVSPIVHGKGSETDWCAVRGQTNRGVSRDIYCPPHTFLKVDLERHVATCTHRTVVRHLTG